MDSDGSGGDSENESMITSDKDDDPQVNRFLETGASFLRSHFGQSPFPFPPPSQQQSVPVQGVASGSSLDGPMHLANLLNPNGDIQPSPDDHEMPDYFSVLASPVIHPVAPVFPGGPLPPAAVVPVVPGGPLPPAAVVPVVPGGPLPPAAVVPVVPGGPLPPAAVVPVVPGGPLPPTAALPGGVNSNGQIGMDTGMSGSSGNPASNNGNNDPFRGNDRYLVLFSKIEQIIGDAVSSAFDENREAERQRLAEEKKKHEESTNPHEDETAMAVDDDGYDGGLEDDDTSMPKRFGKQERDIKVRDERLKPIHRDMNKLFLKFKLYFDKKLDYPIHIDKEIVKQFEENKHPGPLIPVGGQAMALEWNKTAGKSEWNKRCIEVLSKYYLMRLKEGKAEVKEAKFVDGVTDLKWIKKVVIWKLGKVRMDWVRRDDYEVRYEKETIENRQSGRQNCRLKFRKKIASFFMQTIKKYVDNPDPALLELWSQVFTVLETLGVDGQSGDETDGTDELGVKKVRRVGQPFLCQDIIDLKWAVDSYAPLVNKTKEKVKQGPPPFGRPHESRRDSTHYMTKLPVNWYNPAWYKPLHETMKDSLRAKKSKPIPKLVPYKPAEKEKMAVD